ncbi:MAG: EF-P lysine aminoacylase EpmA [Gammaproteobacteria bacterium]|nr:EF-P lysine aminoacylase EpmA [Gammaproteobacteria bacterium]
MPSGSDPLASLKIRARIRKRIRAFFDALGVMEVETPILARAGVTDPHIDSLQTSWSDHSETVYLQTSPEYAMKRLLAAGSGPIYQLSKVFRHGERGRQHHPEFTMLEWYRPGYDHHRLMLELDDLIRKCLSEHLDLEHSVFLSYRQAWLETIDIDPFTANTEQLKAYIDQQGIDVSGLDDERDDWLQLIMTHCIEPALPKNTPFYIYDFPSSQAALARIRHDNPPVAERFELYINGMELANGFHELIDADEQRKRFEMDLIKRQQMGKVAMPIDEKLLNALPDMPDCAGVAVGVDRLLMVAVGAAAIDEVLSFVVDE